MRVIAVAFVVWTALLFWGSYSYTKRLREFEASCKARGGVVLRQKDSGLSCIDRKAILL
jgi:hypothetical protein